MIETTLGICLLLTVMLGVLQLVLVFHGALAAHSAATRVARVMALTNQQAQVDAAYKLQTRTALAAVRWNDQPVCRMQADGAYCTVTVKVPAILPGGGMMFGQGNSWVAVQIDETGYYPQFGGMV